ncbi:MAG: PAS domain S-box protein [Bacteroidota bacterium]
MIYNFTHKDDLEEIVRTLQININNGTLTINEPPGSGIQINDAHQPDSTNRFFSINAKKIIEILNHISEPVFIKDHNSEWLFVNHAFCKLLNIKPNEILGKTSQAIFPKKKAEIFETQDKRVLETGLDTHIEEEIQTKDGAKRIVITKKKLFIDIENKPYIIGTFYEITELRKIEYSTKQANTELETRVKERTTLLTQIIHQLQDEINQRKTMQLALSESEDKFRSVIEQSLEGIMLFNSEGRIIEWNIGMTRITGISNQNAIGEYQWDVEFQLMKTSRRNEETYNKLKNITLKTISDRKVNPAGRYVEGPIVSVSGKERYINLTIFEISTKNDFYIGKIVRDISRQRKTALALERSEHQYRAIFENANDAILILNPKTTQIITANEKASQVYGFTYDELSKLNLKHLAKNLSYDQIQIDSLIENKVIKNFETIHFGNTKEEIYMLVNGSMIEYNGEKAIMNINHDITELKKSEKARAATYKISQLIHIATNFDELYESVHTIISELMNAPNFYIALYDENTELISFPYFVDEKDTQPQTRKLRRGLTEYVLRYGKPLLTNPDLIKKLEKEGEIEVLGSLSADWLGVPLITRKKVIGVIAVQSYSKGMHYTNKEKDLLVFISEQIALLIIKKQAEDQIIRAKEIAENSDRLKTALIANMSHELRTPMTGILGFASLLRQQIKDTNSQSMLDNILLSSERLMSTLNSILSLSQLEASKNPLEIVRTNLSTFIEISLIPIQFEANKKQIFIKKILQPNLFAAFNENFLIQILNNLVSNAIKFTEKGGITIETGITTYREKEYAFISIADTGIGISKDHYNLIFEEFRQVSEGLNRTYEGSGLGLSLCKKMSELMGGKIIVDSVLGKGSVFTIYLPQAEAEKIAETHSHPKQHENKSTINPTEKYKVLVVDDNKINGELIEAYLKKYCVVDIANNGLLAIELVKKSAYDLIFMDINLGEGMDGIETACEINKLNSKLPLIALTAFSTESGIEKIMSKYFTSFLLKPIDKNALVEVLEQNIRK